MEPELPLVQLIIQFNFIPHLDILHEYFLEIKRCIIMYASIS